MFLFGLLGAGLTVLTLALLGLAGYLLARALLREEAETDLLGLSIAVLLATLAIAVAIGLLLGALGVLRLDLGLAVVLALVVILRRFAAPAHSLHPTVARLWARVTAHPALSIIAAHAAGSELLRGLLRPPLAWDSLMYHLLLTATWLQDRNLKPVFGPYPVNDYGYVPANGSIWFWWWMAPSHSELWVNLSAFPFWLLFGLAVGGVARELGARRTWPLAAFVALLTPTVVRFVATQYVDLLIGGTLAGACFFGLRWLARPRYATAVLAGLGLGVAAGAKVLGPPYAAVLATALVLCARGDWRRRVPQIAAAVLIALALGSYFYLRNIAAGAGPLALACEERVDTAADTARGAMVPTLPRPSSPVDLLPKIGFGQIADAFLGITRPQSMELGAGPQSLLLLLVALALPFGLPRGYRLAGLAVASQVWFELLFWALVPFAGNLHIFANIRYLVPAIGLVLASGAALAEGRMSERWAEVVALALAVQGLLQLHAEMPHGVRLTLGVIDVVLVAFAASAGLRALMRRRARPLALAALAALLLAAPLLARFRVADRPRALVEEWTAHSTSAKVFARAWGWLDQNGGDGTVAYMGVPGAYFVYPVMGPYLERRARYVNVNREDLHNAASYPRCNPRINPSFEAWIANLDREGARWLLLSRYPEFGFPPEQQWVAQHLDRFILRYADEANLVYEIKPTSTFAGRRGPRQ